MSSDELQQIIDEGNDLAIQKYYKLACFVLFFYDYFLTLDDEIRFVWRGKKSWVSVLFFANRYVPVAYQLWSLSIDSRPTFSQRICDKSIFFTTLTYTCSTLFAQLILTLRIYAITMKNRIVVTCCLIITIVQFVLGVYSTVLAGMNKALQVPQIPLEVFRVCTTVEDRPLSIGYVTLSSGFDLFAFLIIMYTALRSNSYRWRIPSLFMTMAQDATYYFLFIFTSQLALEFTMIFGRPSIQLVPGIGNLVYFPMMAGRLMLSLKKAASPHGDTWAFGEPTTSTGLRFIDRRGAAATRDEIHMETFVNGHEGAGRESGDSPGGSWSHAS